MCAYISETRPALLEQGESPPFLESKPASQPAPPPVPPSRRRVAGTSARALRASGHERRHLLSTREREREGDRAELVVRLGRGGGGENGPLHDKSILLLPLHY